MIRAAAIAEALRAALPHATGVRLAEGREVPVWSRPPTAAEQSRADAILARFAGLPPVLTDEQTADLRADAAIDALSDVLIELVQEVVRGAPNRTPDEIRAAVRAGRRTARRP